MNIKINTYTSITVLIIAFWGEPDLLDAIIYWLMK